MNKQPKIGNRHFLSAWTVFFFMCGMFSVMATLTNTGTNLMQVHGDWGILWFFILFYGNTCMWLFWYRMGRDQGEYDMNNMWKEHLRNEDAKELKW